MEAVLLPIARPGVSRHLREARLVEVAGRERCDAEARWNELFRAYQDLPTDAG
jgi:hypothetical protein